MRLCRLPSDLAASTFTVSDMGVVGLGPKMPIAILKVGYVWGHGRASERYWGMSGN